jgi:hypothetical protein
LKETLPATEKALADETDEVIPTSVAPEAAVDILAQAKPKAVVTDESGPARSERLNVVA